MPDNAKPNQSSETRSNHQHDKRSKNDVPAPGTRRPHAEATDKGYDELEALRRYLFTQR